jgi:dCMP deaminase
MSSIIKVVHAEVNAILNKCSASVRGATIYVALFPCVRTKMLFILTVLCACNLTSLCLTFHPQNECSKVIIQSGIREVVYLQDYYRDTDACKASRIMFKMAGVKLRQYQPKHEVIVIDFGMKE